MAYFPDLSPYRYNENHQSGVVHVGWLGEGQPFSTGIVAPQIVAKLKELTKHPVELYRGKHVCECCTPPGPPFVEGKMSSIWWEWAKERESNGEIRVEREGIIYAAPLLIIHYIEAHGYLPPQEFLNAVKMHRME